MPPLTLAAHEGEPVRIRVDEFDTTLSARLKDPASRPQPGEVVLYWLGQAGFVIDCDGLRMLIDPYLSDSLADKYRGTRYPHRRMMPAPLVPADLDRLDLVLCTHRHTDHMDPGTLQPLARRFPDLRFVVPGASIDEAMKRCGAGADRLIPVNADTCVKVLERCHVSPVASAHETLDVDDAGRHPWLGYVIEVHGVRLYHSGDCVPYADLARRVALHEPDVALLPVNGRDEARSGNGVPGNFTLDEAIALAKEARVPAMIAHHYGLFDFNTISPREIDARVVAEQRGACELFRAQTQRAWRLVKTDRT
ncbi:L-ascorbate metabolism protein UlaG, beta-lactamase superfamily [Paraburkholderia sartisoli]|uniref:L-ascorbate metabolism protein UlaG, beta-lactamase superfamily n=1 Tax=Paraburkholderia sartisoli TaxID=83784 RepID=A0A1H4B2J5_9BURK|nr:L-ascorbate metabolism protein UlaG, beta-lactamase superfamily [Paraburkholderia sartisoli]